MDAIERINAQGMSATLDFLGEDVFARDEALRSRDAYFELLAAIRSRGVNSNVSVKLTAMGLLVSEDFAYENLKAVAEAAATNADPFVRVDMEGSAVTDATLRVFERVYADHKNVGSVLQAYMKRTPGDIETMIALNARVRLCKGAYKEPAEVAFQKKSEVDANYVKLMKTLLKSGVYHGIATHDENMIRATIEFAQNEKIPASAFEFQMLYGVRRDLQQKLVKEGWACRVYIPFGTEWYPYLMRRLAERPANAIFILKNLFR